MGGKGGPAFIGSDRREIVISGITENCMGGYAYALVLLIQKFNTTRFYQVKRLFGFHCLNVLEF